MAEPKEKMSDDAFTFLCFMVVAAVVVVSVIGYQLWENYNG